MKILFIGPLPDPFTGHSLACKVFLEELMKSHEVEIVNLSKAGKNNLQDGFNSLGRVFEVFGILCKVWRGKKGADLIYLTISESVLGNIKDILIYLICFKKLSQMVIHLHGGSIKKWIFDRYRSLLWINRYLIRRLGAAVVLGPSHVKIFTGLIPEKKIHIVPNFSEEYLFTTEEKIRARYQTFAPLRILFLSNFVPGKGFDTLLDAYLAQSDEFKKKVSIDFAGAFDSEAEKEKFLQRINGSAGLHYHGTVHGVQKKDLLARAHLFCLPSALHEGQPMSILEAYASGSVVVTTGSGGIPDIFRDRVNGFEVEAGSIPSLKRVLDHCIQHSSNLLPIAMHNFRNAQEKYRMSQYNASLMKIVGQLANA